MVEKGIVYYAKSPSDVSISISFFMFKQYPIQCSHKRLLALHNAFNQLIAFLSMLVDGLKLINDTCHIDNSKTPITQILVPLLTLFVWL